MDSSKKFNMRRDCKNYESRTYKTGETIRKCSLDAAPNAPFECPNDCVFFVKRKYVGTWDYGSFTDDMVRNSSNLEKDENTNQVKAEVDNSSSSILEELEQIINEASPTIIRDVKYNKLPWYKKLFKRKK